MGLPALDLDAGRALAITGRLELANEAGLFELGERARNLAHGDLERIVRVGEVVTRGREDAHAAPYQGQNADFLGDEIAGEPAGVLDQDGAHAVALDPSGPAERQIPAGSQSGPRRTQRGRRTRQRWQSRRAWRR